MVGRAPRCAVFPYTKIFRSLLDRLRSELGVVDFLDVGIGDLRWPTFNVADMAVTSAGDRKSTRLNSSHTVISYAVFCLKKIRIPARLIRQQPQPPVCCRHVA